jgi:hypothetical protein
VAKGFAQTSKDEIFSAARRICSGCSGFCPNFLTSQKCDTWQRVLHKLAKMKFSRRPAEYVQGVQAFAQNFSQVKKVTRGSFKLFKMFRLFRLLPKLSQETKFPCHVAISTGCSRCSGCSGFLPKLSQETKFPCHVVVSTGYSRCSGCSGFYPKFLK